MKRLKRSLSKSSIRLIALALLGGCSLQAAVISVGIRNGAGTGVAFLGFAEPNVPIYRVRQNSAIDVAASTDRAGHVVFKVSGRTFGSITPSNPGVNFAWGRHVVQKLPAGTASKDIPILAFQQTGQWKRAIMRIVR